MPIGRFAEDISGQRFGRWLVIEPRHVNERGHAVFLCRCDCGNEREVVAYRLRNGRSTSCGCLRNEKSAARMTEHGMTNHPLFATWNSMMHRCYVQTARPYPRYGGRGITVCERWHDVRTFIRDNESKATEGLTIDRIDNDGPYSPKNTRWVPRAKQNLNYSRNVFLEFRGKRQTLKEWADETGIKLGTLWDRIQNRKWPPEKALTQRVRGQ